MRHYLAWLCLAMVAFPSTLAGASTGSSVVIDKHDRWGHNDKLGPHEAAYVVCDGYIGSPLLPSQPEATEPYRRNCEVTPPPGALPIIDVPENHSPDEASGYAAYTASVPEEDKVYFVCDGFLNSTAWCSQIAETKAKRLRRSSESRFWELKSKSLIEDREPTELGPETEAAANGNKPTEDGDGQTRSENRPAHQASLATDKAPERRQVQPAPATKQVSGAAPEMQRLAASADRQTEEADPTAKQAPQLKPPRGYGQTDAASRVPQPRLRSQEVYLNPQVSAYIRFRVNQALREYQRYQNQRYHRYHKGYPHYHHR